MSSRRSDSFQDELLALTDDLLDREKLTLARQNADIAASRIYAALLPAQRLVRASKYIDACWLISVALLGYYGVWRDLRDTDYDAAAANVDSCEGTTSATAGPSADVIPTAPYPPDTLRAIVLLAQASEREETSTM